MKRLGNHEYEDEPGDLAMVVDRCTQGLAACLKGMPGDAGGRGPVLKALWDVNRFDVEVGGRNIGVEGTDALFTETTAQEKKAIAEWVRGALGGAGDWARGAYGGMLVELEKDELDDEAFLRVCRETGRKHDVVEKLLELGRVEEAAKEVGGVGDYDLLIMAYLFVKAGHGDVAEGLVLARSRKKESQDTRLLAWLKKRAGQRRDAAEVLSLAERIFGLEPSLDGYCEIRERAEKSAAWPAMRKQLLSQIKARGRSDLLVEVYLMEGQIDEALAAVKKQTGWGWSGLEDRVAKAAEELRPKAAVEIYTKRAEGLIRNGSRGNYREACRFLAKMKGLYAGMGERREWEKYVGGLKEKNGRLRALGEEMDAAGL